VSLGVPLESGQLEGGPEPETFVDRPALRGGIQPDRRGPGETFQDLRHEIRPEAVSALGGVHEHHTDPGELVAVDDTPGRTHHPITEQG
jgi:hypothetical protein